MIVRKQQDKLDDGRLKKLSQEEIRKVYEQHVKIKTKGQIKKVASFMDPFKEFFQL